MTVLRVGRRGKQWGREIAQVFWINWRHLGKWEMAVITCSLPSSQVHSSPTSYKLSKSCRERGLTVVWTWVWKSSPYPSIRPSVRQSVHPSVRQSVRPSVRPSVNPSVRQSVRPSVNPSVRPSIRPYVRQSFRPSIRPSVRPLIRPSVNPSVRPSVNPSVR